jgi:NAD(P)H-hydrate repair Nnr-like enzyme with NAD(P)H-hydrate dehydratase domain
MAEMRDKIVILDADGLYWIHDCPSAAVISPEHLQSFGGSNIISRFLPFGAKHIILTPNEIELYRLVKRFVKPTVEVGELSQITAKLHEYMLQTSPDQQAQIFKKSDILKVCPEIQLLYGLLQSTTPVTILSKGLVDIVIAGEQVGVVNTQAGLKRCGGQGDILSGLVSLYACWDFDTQTEGHPHLYPLKGIMLASLVTREASRRAFETYGISMTSSKIIDSLHLVLKDILN